MPTSWRSHAPHGRIRRVISVAPTDARVVAKPCSAWTHPARSPQAQAAGDHAAQDLARAAADRIGDALHLRRAAAGPHSRCRSTRPAARPAGCAARSPGSPARATVPRSLTSAASVTGDLPSLQHARDRRRHAPERRQMRDHPADLGRRHRLRIGPELVDRLDQQRIGRHEPVRSRALEGQLRRPPSPSRALRRRRSCRPARTRRRTSPR